jgi:glycosyltransferase involved in cell wall biosynthesis
MNSLLINLSFVIPEATGHTTYAINLFPHLQSLEPILLTSRTIDNYTCYEVPPDLTPNQGTRGHFRRLLWTQMRLPQIYKQLQANLLFSPIPEAPLYSNCRFVVMVHDLIPLRFPKPLSPLTPYFRHYIPQVLNRAQHIVCNSKATARDITDFFNIPSKKITPILLAYDAERFRYLNLPIRNYFLYVGRQDPYKNLQRVIAAFAAIPNRDYELWLVGPTDRRYMPILKAKTEQLGVANLVKFLNYVPYSQLPILLNSALALVFPSLWEGFGLPVLEAMACGTPVITSNLSSLPEVAGDAAILVDPHNTAEIAAAMQTIATEEKVRSHLSQLSLTRASQFSWAKTGKATAEVLSSYL